MTVLLTIYFTVGLILGLMALHERGKNHKNDIVDTIGLPIFTIFTWFPMVVILLVTLLKKDVDGNKVNG